MREAFVKRLVYSSSATVYGAPQYLPADEEHPTGVGLTNPYGKTKYFCETIMKDLAASDPVGAAAVVVVVGGTDEAVEREISLVINYLLSYYSSLCPLHSHSLSH